MPEALARMRYDSVLSRPAGRGGKLGVATAWALLRCVLPRRASGYASAALAATMTGIVVNALVFQHERHPAPIFGTVSAPTPNVASKPAAQAPIPALTEAPPPPARPIGLGAGTTAAPRASDPIADILRGGASKEAQKLTVAAQAGLIRLGYALKSGGSGSEFLVALRDFEKSHGLPVSTEITPRLVKQIAAAASSQAAR